MPVMLSINLNAQQKQDLLALAKESVKIGSKDAAAKFILKHTDSIYTEQAACFVTLHKNNKLRGCIGSLEAHRSLYLEVSENAYAAANSDPRFVAVSVSEMSELSWHISILGSPVKMKCNSLNELIEKLDKNKDGLIIEEGSHKATFLPSVWETLPDKGEFVARLQMKAGLPCGYWSEHMEISTYQCQEI